MGDLDSKTWLTYPEAARRVKRSTRSIRLWHEQGMPMRLRPGPHGPERIVDEQTLLAWYREKLQSNVVHQARMRQLAREDGLPVPEWPAAVRRQTAPRRPGTQSAVEDDTPIDVIAQQRREAWLALAKSTALTMGGPEYYALQEALKTETPACDGITAFTDTSTDAEQREIMESICWHCPVLEKCRAFAEVAHPDGFWAGQHWTHARITRTHAA